MWPALSALEPEALPSGERYETRYIQKTNNDYNEKVVGLNPFRETEFRTILLGRTRRVAKADVLKFLPAKQHSVRTVVLPPEWRKAYDDIESKMLAELPDSGELSAVSVLTQLTRLSQLASAPATVEIIPKWDEAKGEWKDHQHVELRAPSWKVTELLNVLAERPGKPTVCFAVSRQLIMLAGTAALAAGLKVGYIVGGQTPKVRTANREAFQRGELDVICVTAAAGGTGLNLTAADTAVFLQRPWSLVDAMQAEDRIHRIGSEIHTSISIIDIVAEATVDSRIRAVLRQKAGHLGELLQDPRIVAQLLGGASVTRMKAKAS
jgi:SNF2 family DNA or RNA helicase